MLTPQEFQAIYPRVMNWIRLTLDASASEACTVVSLEFPRLRHYFSDGLLAATKVVSVDRVPVPPLAALGLNQFSEFVNGNYDGITYLDTFFVKHYRAADERLYFHELIHVVQWRLLGPERFLAAYAAGLEVHGYRNSPLEMMAFIAEEGFSHNAQIFDAEKWVEAQLGRIFPA